MAVSEALRQLRVRLLGRAPSKILDRDEQPLRAELFSAVQMEQHGRSLASAHHLAPRQYADQLLRRLNENEHVLADVCRQLISSVTMSRRVAPAGECLLDNFYFIEEQIRTTKRHLPKGYSRELPRLRSGPSAKLPRVYDLAIEIIAHGDGRVDPENLLTFVAAYQTITVLTLGELWAIPIMLRLALIENLRRVASRIVASRLDQDLANEWAEQMVAMAENDPKNVVLVVADMVRSNPPASSAFVAKLVQQLQGQSAALALPLSWIEQQLAETGLTIGQLVQIENQQQAADQVSIRNSIGSLRSLVAMDWSDFVEDMSFVDRALSNEPSGTYQSMDFATRDQYRHAVEKVAKRSPLSEVEVARHAVTLTQQALDKFGSGERRAHVGFYLVNGGLQQLEKTVQSRFSLTESLYRVLHHFPVVSYLGAITVLTIFVTLGLLSLLHSIGEPWWVLMIISLPTMLSSSHLAIALVNWLATILVTPVILPRLDFADGLPPQSRTIVVIPTILSNLVGAAKLIEALEVRFLANKDDNIHFGLLTDYSDAKQENIAGDKKLLSVVQSGIEALNEKYPRKKGDTFFLFHRARRWNAQESIWMGYERKRGKLHDLNVLLRDGARERFSLIVGDLAFSSRVKYVITLDTDTQLPRDAAYKLVGAMEHPLNRARYDEKLQRVSEGYGILQPRISISLPVTTRSRYAQLFGSESGIDQYTLAVSDVYQDWFGEGSFTGKGIYDVEIVEKALADRFPENQILSHDLLEGCYARSGNISDLQLFEEYPECYGADVSRRYRWIRGDWQIAQWLCSRVPSIHGGCRESCLSVLSRWKLFDNLRRSLEPAALVMMFVVGWTLMASPGLWTLTVLGIMFIPLVAASARSIFQKLTDVGWGQHFTATMHEAWRQFLQAAFKLACLPYEALYSLDAVARTIWRQCISHRRMLEWKSSSEVTHSEATRSEIKFLSFCRMMVIAPVLSVALAATLIRAHPAAIGISSSLLLLWSLSPIIAWWISLPLARRSVRLTVDENLYLHTVARKTWAFFEAFVTPAESWLPPDNFQEQPATIAHRTSPTNMGLSLLANLSAYDFGYITVKRLIERTSGALDTMDGLDRYRGHFYNWYDTQTLKPLQPIYVSSVDSGNLSGHLLTLQAGIADVAGESIIPKLWFDGVRDTCGALQASMKSEAPESLSSLQSSIVLNAVKCPVTMTAMLHFLDTTATQIDKVCLELSSKKEIAACEWARTLGVQCQDMLADLVYLAPWLTLSEPPFGLSDSYLPNAIPSLRELGRVEVESGLTIERQIEATESDDARVWLQSLLSTFQLAGSRARARIASLDDLVERSGVMSEIEYDFLYDDAKHLVAIGYNVGERQKDAVDYYDLLASEARMGTFVGIAQGDLPQESWFAMGRPLTRAAGEATLISWSGSMFEYLMPLLVMPTYEHTLLDQACRTAVARQIEYGRQRGVPWGVSESGYNRVDIHLIYQYRAFGVPGLGLKRGLAEDLVIAPYATALALLVSPEEACRNLQKLSNIGMEGKYGFYEAIDYTTARLQRGQTSAIVKSFMAHHQGMVLLSLASLLLGQQMQRRFASVPQFQATALLLQERVPKASQFYSHLTGDITNLRTTGSDQEAAVRVYNSPNTPIPEVQLLSNGSYHVMVTNAGGGYSRWKDLAVTRWREDTTCDSWGTFCYLRDVESGEFWSNTYQPTLQMPDNYESIFSEERAEFRRNDHGIESYTQIAVSPEDDIELRRLRITNCSQRRRVIEVTSYAEVVVAKQAADALHPAFSNLFVLTEILWPQPAILCSRRPRSLTDSAPWMLHLLAVRGAQHGEVTYETDRMRFIGRGSSVEEPKAMSKNGELSGSAGSVLDPIVAIRYQITLEPEQSATVDMVLGMGETREVALGLIEKYQDQRLADRVFDLALTHSQVALRQLNATESDVQLYKRLASSILYANAGLRAAPSVLSQNRSGQSGLWSHAVSGDVPIVLLQIGDASNIELVQQLVQAHRYWSLKGLIVDLVIWNEVRTGYRQLLQDQIMGLIAAGVEAHVIDRPGGIFVRPADQITREDRILFQTVARAIISDRKGSLAEQLRGRRTIEKRVPRLKANRRAGAAATGGVISANSPAYKSSSRGGGNAVARGGLKFDNGLGGFASDGREYVITTGYGRVPPAPWINVIANPTFGTIISEQGSGYTWSDNAHEFRLTPWYNDPVCDPSGEAFYLRDEDDGTFWSPSPQPCGGATSYVCRHGFGYTVFEHTEGGIQTELWVYVAIDAAIKYSVLKVRNVSGRSRRISATGYVEWVLGDLRSKSALHIVTELDPTSGALLARNSYNSVFADSYAFFDVGDTSRSFTGDRKEFIGRNGTMRNPAAMMRAHLSNKVGAGLDSCAALQVGGELAPGQEHEIVFRLGIIKGRGVEDVSHPVLSGSGAGGGTAAARGALDTARKHWSRVLGAVRVETPDKSLDILANGWLLYQTIGCRLWGRSGFYQSGGAFGYRDQLQDSMALIHAAPELTRSHLLTCAKRQFVEGDVQHWWHTPTGRGVRTHCSDDFLWLPLAVCRYVIGSGDVGVLDESAQFLEGRAVNALDDSYYDLPMQSAEEANLYQHCVRAINRGLRLGVHGLPLMGSGDWNDGMNLVGMEGKGESVWLGFFLYDVLMQFSKIALLRGDIDFVEKCGREAAQLRENLREFGWDGNWYRRAYFDDGTPLGSASSPECKIDSIAQSWSVLSGAGDLERAQIAMNSLDTYLVRREHQLIQLLDPPFDKSDLNPGYIKGYWPGIRENGGQYTHAAVWAAMAFGALKDTKRSWELFAMINPINHSLTPEGVSTYKVEPYVLSGDVYSVAPHIGRGGWSWYTGSAGWMYRLIVESLLGLRRENDLLTFSPCIPVDWPEYKLRYRFGETYYDITVTQGSGQSSVKHITVDGVAQDDMVIRMVDDLKEHRCDVVL